MMFRPNNYTTYSRVFAFTDGSAVVNGKNKGKGGFGVYLPSWNPDFEKSVYMGKGYRLTKTGRMELTALLYALKYFPKDPFCEAKTGIDLVVCSDSEYVVKAFTEKRLQKWQLNNWVNTSGPVKNIDLWKEILAALGARPQIKLTMMHVKGHTVDKEKDPKKKKELLKDPYVRGNYIADKLADYKRYDFYHEDLASL